MGRYPCITVKSHPIRRAKRPEYPPDYPRRHYKSGKNGRLGYAVSKTECIYQLPCFVVCATGSVLSVWDAEKLGCGRWEGRWLTRCSLHGAQAYHSSAAKAIESARTASFCRRCYVDALRSSPCPYCLKATRGCVLCDGDTNA